MPTFTIAELQSFLADLHRLSVSPLGVFLMSALSDKIAADTAAADAAIARSQAVVADLRAQVAALEARIATEAFTPDDLAALDALKVKLDALDPASPVVIAPDPNAPQDPNAPPA